MSKLILVATPIGNLEDLTRRAVRVLEEADLILAEDTRMAAKLLAHLGIKKKVLPHHAHNEHRYAESLARRIEAGETMALTTDAGTPGISDPGFLLVNKCLELGVGVECLPGPTAFVPALVVSGLPADRFCFEGFLPVKKGRQKALEALSVEERTMVFYESPHRLLKTLGEMKIHFGENRRASVSRELSKIFEETTRGSLEELVNHFQSGQIKGEFVIVVEGKRN